MRSLQIIVSTLFASLIAPVALASAVPLCPNVSDIIDQNATGNNLVRCDVDKKCVYDQLTAVTGDKWWVFMEFPEGTSTNAMSIAQKELPTLKYKSGPMNISSSVQACYYSSTSGYQATALVGI